MSTIVRTVELNPYEHLSSGKVREIFKVGDNHLLLVATDRLSAFDVVFPGGIPGKGQVLTQLAAFWFEKTAHIVPNHMVTASLDEMPEALRDRVELEGRCTLCRRSKVFPVECVVRGYLEGSGWKEYQESQTVCDIPLPAGLRRRSRLPEPIFTPATKAEQGEHDENIDFERCCGIVGRETAEELRRISIALYNFAHAYLDERGIVIADTKFEFGIEDGRIALIDEALTPDSSRFWVKGSFEAGGEPISYDKQYVRDYLEALNWNKRPPAPELPAEVIANTSRRYIEIYEKITGRTMAVETDVRS
jgi:phosphoribosylaminoimidazole-succinocarboxamide synthase